MKKIIITIALTAAFTILFAATALAVDATVDTANGSKGLVTVTLKNWDKDKDDVRIIIQKDGKNLDVFNPVKANSTIPITFGKGEYEIMVGVNMGGGRLSVKTKVKVNVSAPDEKLWYTTSNAKVDFASSTKAVPNLKKLSDGKKTEREKATPIYEYIVTNFTYDHDLASKIIAGTVTSYVPIIDTVYDMKKAICYGYSVVFAGAARNIEIPMRVVEGFVPELVDEKTKKHILHAWNEIYLDGKWIPIDTTFDTSLYAANKKFGLTERSRTKFEVVKTY